MTAPITTTPLTLVTRTAAYSDAEPILAMLIEMRPDRERTNMIHQAITTRTCHVAIVEGNVAAFAIVQPTFFGHPFINFLFVHPDARRHGVGRALIRHIEQHVATKKLFVAIERTQVTLQAFFIRTGFIASGSVDHINDIDTQLIYFKRTGG
ncbi:MAG: GNAT family N-acetyltransferase [Phycisphaeraceae bacterium]